MNSFSALKSWLTHGHFRPMTGFKMDALLAEKVVVFGRKKPFLKLN